MCLWAVKPLTTNQLIQIHITDLEEKYILALAQMKYEAAINFKLRKRRICTNGLKITNALKYL